MKKFTQGEWEITEHLDVKCGTRYIAPISIFVVHENEDGEIEDFATEEDYANARLIANAPKMYSLLVKIHDTGNINQSEIKELINAID